MTDRCTSRKKFASQASAHAAARRLASAGQERYPTECRHCRGWHLARRGETL
ncbi:hypothetical protein D3C78_297930 [compost metagenome]